ncbi:MAG: prephenate/arogenate dehydrogenase family protein [Caulobacterales bacterium]
MSADAQSPVFDSMGVVGIGLIGASIALAARANSAAKHIVLFDASEDVRRRAAELGLGDVVTDPAQIAACDAVFLCVPVGQMKSATEMLAPHLKKGAILTDTGSVKTMVRDALISAAPEGVFVIPGHPIAGTEHSGPDAGFATLFQGRWQLLTPLAGQGADYDAAVERLAEFWRRLGSRVDQMDSERHDLVLAITSHLPHLIAFNIVGTAADLEKVTESEVVKYSASGFRDFTRIAASDPVMWRDVFLSNKDAVLEMLGRFTEDLAALQRAIRWGDGDALHDFFTRARAVRRHVIEAGQDTALPDFGRGQPPATGDADASGTAGE